MQILRVPTFGFGIGEAGYYGRRHFVIAGWWIILWGQMTDEEIWAYDDRSDGDHPQATDGGME